MLKIAWSDIYAHHLPPGHRFPMEKYNLLPEQLLYEGIAEPDSFFAPLPVAEEWILKAHDPVYWQRLKNLELSHKEARRTGFPLSAGLVHREIVIAQGTIDCALYALELGVSLNIAGGTHHAFTDRGEGFCLLNDIAIAAHYLLDKQLATKVLVIDLDVHQGNGTAEIFQYDNRVFTFSMHGAKNYPLRKEISDLDIALPDGANDMTYLTTLRKTLPGLVAEVKPDFVFFQSGVDVLATDKLGRLGMSIDGCRQRDQIVFDLCKQHQLPIAVSMGGGYSPKIADIVNAHTNTYRLAQEIFF
ncbi:histone deacetylase family protein [Microscilla marina]|uniref:Histone deacetylase superfamily n=1 Tax=Microscilla marina ATCC 23134 TaxID=313606 RepID=A1ZPR4_MICM2|nr:histone deacetylase [Microscilla marina]EAY27569.1 histone deacetylase superfamily [Microscilla marina ATCC 23134]